MALNSWDKRYLGIAKQVSDWTKDPSSAVGAVIADRKGRVVALGFNGFPKKVHDHPERYSNRGQKYPRVVHAEANAALIAGVAADGGTVYVYGRPVCSHCAGILIQAGIKRVVAEPPCDGTATTPPSGEPLVDWDELGRVAIEMFGEAKVRFEASHTRTNGTAGLRQHRAPANDRASAGRIERKQRGGNQNHSPDLANELTS